MAIRVRTITAALLTIGLAATACTGGGTAGGGGPRAGGAAGSLPRNETLGWTAARTAGFGIRSPAPGMRDRESGIRSTGPRVGTRTRPDRSSAWLKRGGMAKQRPTIADIARRAGVSKGAVSYALNDRPGVSPETRAAIKAIAEEIGWRPNSAARALTHARVDAVGLALCRPAHLLGVEPFFMELISGMESELAARGCALLLQVVPDPAQELEVYRRWWGERRVDGVFLADLRHADPRIPGVTELGMPAVVIGHPGAAGPLPAVWSDDAAALRDTVTYLAALGHRRVARVAGLPDLVHTRLRDEAYRALCGELGLDGPLLIHTDYTGEEGAHATSRLISGPRRPTAVIYDNDIMVVAGLSVAQEMGLDVPRDLSLVAWDDSQLSRVVRPPLTALGRDIPAYGARAARILLDLIAGAPAPAHPARGRAPAYEETAARLVPRGSTGRAAARA